MGQGDPRIGRIDRLNVPTDSMRLARWSLHHCLLPYSRPVRWSDVVETRAEFVLLRLETSDGCVGVAEVVVKPTWSGVTTRTLVASVEELFVPVLGKARALDVGEIRIAMESIPENQAAKTLVDNALWDLVSASAGAPLWRMWGGRARVAVSWAVTRQAPGAMADEAATMVARHGLRTLKVKGGQGLATDVAAMRAIRAAIGEEVELYVDANGAYPQAQAAEYVAAMADEGAVAVEDPCELVLGGRFRALQAASSVPIVVDFGCTSARDAALFLEQGARALSVKPGRIGLSRARAMASMAHAAGCTTITGLFGESALGSLCALQLASTLASPSLPAEVTWFLEMTEQVLPAPCIERGEIGLPDQAGFASQIDWSRLDLLAKGTVPRISA